MVIVIDNGNNFSFMPLYRMGIGVGIDTGMKCMMLILLETF